MTSSELIPTPIVDKNGKQTTVRRKQSSAKVATSLSSAKPVAAPKPAHIDRLNSDGGAVESLLKEQMSLKARKLSNKRIGAMLDGLQPDTLEKLQTIYETNDDGEFVVRQVIQESAIGAFIAPMNNLAMLHETTGLERYKQRMFHTYVNGLWNLEGFTGEEDFSKLPTESQHAVRAVLRVTLSFDSKRVRSSNIGGAVWAYLTSQHLAKLVFDRPDDADKIISILQSRPDVSYYGRSDIVQMVEMLDQDVIAPFTDGIL